MIRFDGKELYTIDECASIIGVTIRSIYNYIKQGDLAANKVGRRWYVSEEVLDSYITGKPYTPAPSAGDTDPVTKS